MVLAGAVGLLMVSWSAAQFALSHRYWSMFVDWRAAKDQLFVQTHPSFPMHRMTLLTRYWVQPAVGSIAALLALSLVAALLVRGGWRWWALLVTAMPAANLLWGWRDSRTFGAGWIQWPGSGLVPASTHTTAWLVGGVVVDTLLVALVATALVLVVPARPSAPSRGQLWRVAPVLVVLAGWWLMRNPLPDRLAAIWLVQALAYVLVLGLLCVSSLPLATRGLATLVVLPFCASATATAVLSGDGAPGLVHHDAFALATAIWIVGGGWLFRSLRPPRTSLDPVEAGT